MKVTGGAPAVRLPQGSIGTWAMSNVLWGRGGQYSDGWDLKLDQPETLEAARYARGLVFDSKIANVAAASGDTAVDFAGGLAPCTIASAGAVGIVTASAKFPIGTGVLPGGPQGQFVPTGGTGLAVVGSKTKEQQLAAGMFIKHVTEVDQQVAFAKKTGYAPVRTSARPVVRPHGVLGVEPGVPHGLRQPRARPLAGLGAHADPQRRHVPAAAVGADPHAGRGSRRRVPGRRHAAHVGLHGERAAVPVAGARRTRPVRRRAGASPRAGCPSSGRGTPRG
ncbi:extracellular solute-binding protein [Clavibacter tessellarius]|uniref:extracellular solute-binding protein n=1 Tax=Clavibacter tessellarius TaxID=31965 RepID=UPI00324E3C41